MSTPFKVLEGVIPLEQIMGLWTMVSNHRLQRQKLITAGSYLQGLQEETLNLHTNTESLTGWVDCVLVDMVQLVLDWDNILYTLSRAFGSSTEPQIDPTPCAPSVTHDANHCGEGGRREWDHGIGSPQSQGPPRGPTSHRWKYTEQPIDLSSQCDGLRTPS
jgi:hypothetical protein